MGILETAHQITGLPKDKILRYGLIAIVLFVVFGIGQAILTTLLGVAYPVFMSFHALETDGLSDDQQWLTYWVVFGLFNVLDQFAGFILRFIPFYYVLKLAVLIWLFHPKSVGATWVYNNYIKEYAGHINEIEKHVEGQIKEGINTAKKTVGLKTN
jgi:receptor expression-enhancing protein 5/6